MMSICILAAAGEVVTDGQTNSQTIIMDDVRGWKDGVPIWLACTMCFVGCFFAKEKRTSFSLNQDLDSSFFERIP